jgi:hypothetical protein
LWLLLLSTWSSAQQGPVQPRTPRFTSKVDVTSIDVTVVDDSGKPILDLKPSDFTVRIDNAPRRVVTAEWTLVTETGPPRLLRPMAIRRTNRRRADESVRRRSAQHPVRREPEHSTDRRRVHRSSAADRSHRRRRHRSRQSLALHRRSRARQARDQSRMTGMSRQLEVGDFNISATEAAATRAASSARSMIASARECAATVSDPTRAASV